MHKSKLLVFSAHDCRRQASTQTIHCSFSIGGNRIERFESFSHLGHIITCSLSDNEDVPIENFFISTILHLLAL